MRIVSLHPSATEIVCAVGLENQLVGISHECDYPGVVKALPKVTASVIPADVSSAEIDALVRERVAAQQALYTLNEPMLAWLAPDLLVTQSLCGVCAVDETVVRTAALRLLSQPRVLSLEPMSLDDVFGAILAVGNAAERQRQAQRKVYGLQERVQRVTERSAGIPAEERPRVAFLEWLAPLFCGGHWNPALVEMAGGVDVLGRSGEPSRTTAWEELLAAAPEVIFIACCGYDRERALKDLPLLEARGGWHTFPAIRSGRVYVVDGNAYFNRPGPRLVDSLEILAHALHPALHPGGRASVAVPYAIANVREALRHRGSEHASMQLSLGITEPD